MASGTAPGSSDELKNELAGEGTGDGGNGGDAGGDGPAAGGAGDGNIHELRIERELSESYLTYAMSTIMDRALPDVR
ncbi:MAG TPA: hypothetical protein VFF65_09730, partial [Phycisphaerales bacterium]|nr:hypothetical protein [Phycisphaerales bacterium]